MKSKVKVIFAAVLMCVLGLSLFSCGSAGKTIVDSWYYFTEDDDFYSYDFEDDNRLQYYFRSHIKYSSLTVFKWETSLSYIHEDNGEKTEYNTPEGYEGVLVLTKEDEEKPSHIYYYRFDKKKKKLYLADPDGKKDEITLKRNKT